MCIALKSTIVTLITFCQYYEAKHKPNNCNNWECVLVRSFGKLAQKCKTSPILLSMSWCLTQRKIEFSLLLFKCSNYHGLTLWLIWETQTIELGLHQKDVHISSRQQYCESIHTCMRIVHSRQSLLRLTWRCAVVREERAQVVRVDRAIWSCTCLMCHRRFDEVVNILCDVI